MFFFFNYKHFGELVTHAGSSGGDGGDGFVRQVHRYKPRRKTYIPDTRVALPRAAIQLVPASSSKESITEVRTVSKGQFSPRVKKAIEAFNNPVDIPKRIRIVSRYVPEVSERYPEIDATFIPKKVYAKVETDTKALEEAKATELFQTAVEQALKQYEEDLDNYVAEQLENDIKLAEQVRQDEIARISKEKSELEEAVIALIAADEVDLASALLELL